MRCNAYALKNVNKGEQFVSNPFRELGALQPYEMQIGVEASPESFKPLSGIGCVATHQALFACCGADAEFQTPFGNWVRCNRCSCIRRSHLHHKVSNPFRELGALQQCQDRDFHEWRDGFKPLSGIGCVATLCKVTEVVPAGAFQTPRGNYLHCNRSAR